jgi:hypothetical protein
MSNTDPAAGGKLHLENTGRYQDVARKKKRMEAP